MLSDMLKSVSGLELYPIISLLLFFVTFLFMLLKVWKMDKSYLKHMGRMPLDNDDNNSERGSKIK